MLYYKSFSWPTKHAAVAETAEQFCRLTTNSIFMNQHKNMTMLRLKLASKYQISWKLRKMEKSYAAMQLLLEITHLKFMRYP